ncbi:MAG: hypothetical protein R3F61_27275 [Myxococcota bacterium]
MSSGGTSRALALLALLLLAGCPKQTASVVDIDLPEKASGLTERPPREILEEGAASLEPSHRGQALGFLIRTSPEPGGGEWGPRALYDPDGWVQRQGVQALVERIEEPEARAHLVDYLGRDTADPYSRGYAAVRLRDHSSPEVRATLTEAWRAESQRWRAAPLALGALVHGDETALEPLSAALSRGDIALEAEFVHDVGASGRPELLAALQEGEDWVEEELALAYAVARVSLGDGSGEQLLRKALSSEDATTQLDALDQLSDLHDPAADALLRRARSQGPELMRTWADLALAARGDGDPAIIVTAAGSSDGEIRALAARFAGERLEAGAPKKVARSLEQTLRGAVLDRDARVRRAALGAIGAAHLADQAVLLGPVLTDESFENRLEAAGLLLASKQP